MKRTWKVSGKSWALPRVSSPPAGNLRPGGWYLLPPESKKENSGARRRVFFHKGKQGNATLLWSGKLWQGVVESSEDHRETSSGAGSGAEADFRAQFPGKVRKVLAQAGQSVQAGEVLIRVEAMKMEFAISAPVAGTVIQIRVKEGQSLSPGELLLDFKAASSPEKGSA